MPSLLHGLRSRSSCRASSSPQSSSLPFCSFSSSNRLETGWVRAYVALTGEAHQGFLLRQGFPRSARAACLTVPSTQLDAFVFADNGACVSPGPSVARSCSRMKGSVGHTISGRVFPHLHPLIPVYSAFVRRFFIQSRLLLGLLQCVSSVGFAPRPLFPLPGSAVTQCRPQRSPHRAQLPSRPARCKLPACTSSLSPLSAASSLAACFLPELCRMCSGNLRDRLCLTSLAFGFSAVS